MKDDYHITRLLCCFSSNNSSYFNFTLELKIVLISGVAQCMRCDARASPKIATPKFFFA